VEDWEEAAGLHNQLVYRVTTSLFTNADNPNLEEMANRLKTGSLNVNRATIGASLRLPSVGLGRSSNGIPAGIDILRFLSTPRAMLVERRPFDASQVVPGVHWDSSEPLTDNDLTGDLIPETG
jgi:acyl-CoA reductase-like NAD-dependent aldehyde dehydrogenase